jgi:integrase/recombinase XerD
MSQVGCRSLSDEEVTKLKKYFFERTDKLALRDYTILFFSLYTGFRISETLSLKVSDVWNGTVVLESVYLKRSHMKGKWQGRNVIMSERCKTLLSNYIHHYDLQVGEYLFPNNRSDPEERYNITSRQAERIFKKAFAECQLTGMLSTHTSRKTFAEKCYEKLDRNLMDLSTAMGHKSISATAHYIKTNNKKIQDVVKNLDF